MLWVCKVNYKIKAVERTYFHVIWTIRARSDFVGPKDKQFPPPKKKRPPLKRPFCSPKTMKMYKRFLLVVEHHNEYLKCFATMRLSGDTSIKTIVFARRHITGFWCSKKITLSTIWNFLLQFPSNNFM